MSQHHGACLAVNVGGRPTGSDVRTVCSVRCVYFVRVGARGPVGAAVSRCRTCSASSSLLGRYLGTSGKPFISIFLPPFLLGTVLWCVFTPNLLVIVIY